MFTIGWLIGILSIRQVPQLDLSQEKWFIIMGCLAITCRTHRATMLGILAGTIWISWFALQRQQIMIHEVENRWVEGIICSPIQLLPMREQMTFCLDHQRVKLVLEHYRYHTESLLLGKHYRLLVHLKPWHALQNEIEPWWLLQEWSQRKIGRGYIIKIQPLTTTGQNSLIRYRINLWQELISHHFDDDINALIASISLGYRQGFSSTQYQNWQFFGLWHLLAISGLHITLICQLILNAIRWSIGSWLKSFDHPGWLIGSGLIGLVFVELIDWNAGALRAWVAWVLSKGHQQLWWTLDKLQQWWASIIIVSIITPLAIWLMPFWLSAMAALVLQQTQHTIRWKTTLRLQWVLSPWYAFGGLPWSWGGLLGDLLLCPIIANLLLPLTIVPILLPHALRNQVWLLDHFLWKHCLAGLSFFHQYAHGPLQWLPAIPDFYLAYLFSFVLYAIPWSLGILIWMPLLINYSWFQIRMTLFDVGQGLATIIDNGQKAIVYDTGPGNGEHSQSAEIIYQFIQRHHLTLNQIIVSHGDADHAGGVLRLHHYFPDVVIYTGQPERLKVDSLACFAGQHQQLGLLSWQILWPKKNLSHQPDNEYSCVVLFNNPIRRWLMTGDASKTSEIQLAILPDWQPIELIVGHHGSKTATSTELLSALQPHIGLISSGWHNRYHHPHPTIINRLRHYHIEIFNTADHGMIQCMDRKRCQTTAEKWNYFWLKE